MQSIQQGWIPIEPPVRQSEIPVPTWHEVEVVKQISAAEVFGFVCTKFTTKRCQVLKILLMSYIWHGTK